MPQNYETHNVDLNQRLYEAVLEMPAYDLPRPEFLKGDKYRVVDVVLRDGREIDGILVIGDTLLLAPDVESFTAEEIVEITPTPVEKHPDFTITDPDSVRRHQGIEWMNAERLSMFGPEDQDDEPDWRNMPVDEAWEEAIRDNGSIHTFDGELPASWHGLSLETLSDNGFLVSQRLVSPEQERTRVVRPRSIAVWSEILGSQCRLDTLTLRGLLELLDLPDETARYVFAASMPHYYGAGTFQEWLAAVREAGVPQDPDIEYIQVSVYADTYDNLTIETHFGASAMSYPLEKDDPESGFAKGDRINYALHSINPAALGHVSIRYEPDLIIPGTHAEQMAYYRGPLRDWRVGGEIGPRPEMPIKLRARRNIDVGELIGAVLSETARKSS